MVYLRFVRQNQVIIKTEVSFHKELVAQIERNVYDSGFRLTQFRLAFTDKLIQRLVRQ